MTLDVLAFAPEEGTYILLARFLVYDLIKKLLFNSERRDINLEGKV